MRFVQAIGVFFKVLFDASYAQQLQQLEGTLANDELAKTASSDTPAEKGIAGTKPMSARSDAIALLAALQREARFIDIVQESLDGYSDEQIGAAARDVLKDSRKVIERMFGITPVVDAEEGSEIETPEKFDAAEFRLTGNVTGTAPFKGALVHHGWKASRCELPTWQGDRNAAMFIAPVEVELS